MRRTDRIKSWLKGSKYWDVLFAYCEGGFAAVRRLLREITTLHAPPKNPGKRSFPLQVELLEQRVVPSTFRFATASYGFGEAAGLVTITVQRDNSIGSASVYVTDSHVTTDSTDYFFTDTTLYFNDTVSAMTVNVTINDDSLTESSETFKLNLSSPSSGYTLDPILQTTTVTIVDNDTASFQFATSTYSFGEAVGTASVFVQRVGNTQGSASVTVYATNGTATYPSDFNFTSESYNFADGQSQATVSVSIVNDSLVESNETFALHLSAPSAGYSLSPSLATATITIVDNDVQRTPTINWSDPSAITYGTVLSGTQLNATVTDQGTTVPGTLAYNPTAGIQLSVGNQALSVHFTPNDSVTYTTADKTVHITVNKATPTVNVTANGGTYTGSPIGATATVTGVNGIPASSLEGVTPTLTYWAGSSATGTPLPGAPTAAGTYTVKATFAGSTNYNSATSSAVTYTIDKATPVITWNDPSNIAYGTLLSSTQLNASASWNGSNVAGTFVYNPVANTKLNAGNNQPLTVTFTPTDTANYNIAGKTVHINVIAASLSVINITANNKTYDHTTAATLNLSSAALSGTIYSGDTVTLNTSGAVGNFVTKNVGNNITVQITGLTLGGAQGSNYTLIQPTTTANITPYSLVVSASGGSKVYNATTTTSVTLSDNHFFNDNVTDTYTAANFLDKNVGNGKSVSVVGIAITGSDAGNYTLSNTTASSTANITPFTLTVTATAPNKTYDASTTTTVTLADNRFFGDIITTNYASANFDTKNVGNGKTVTVTGISISGTDAGNYTLASTTKTTTANITAKSLTVSATGIDKVYDGTTNATVTFSDNRITNDILTVTGSAHFDTKNVGTGKTVTVTSISITGTDAGNYTLASTTTTTAASITAKPLTVTPHGVNREYDGTAAATVTFTDNRIPNDSLNVSGSATFADKFVANGKSVSVTGISISGTDAGNYSLQNTTGSTTANITPMALTISGISATNKTYDGTTNDPIDGTADLIGVITPDSVQVSGGTASFADKDAGTNKPVTFSGFSISGTDASNYTLTQPASSIATIYKAGLTITALDVTMTYADGTTLDEIDGFTTSGLQASETIASVTLTTNAQLSASGEWKVGTWTITPSAPIGGSTFNAANYAITFENGTLTVNPRPFVVIGLQFAASEGIEFNGAVATFDDPDGTGSSSAYTDITIDWGDGTSTSPDTTPGTLSGPTSDEFTISGTHTYLEEGTYYVKASVTYNNLSPVTSAPVSIVVADPQLIVTAEEIEPTEGVEFSGDVATFTDPGGIESSDAYTDATIDWGDGSTADSTGTISDPDGNGVFTISGVHTYAEEGDYYITVHVTHDALSPAASAPVHITVADAPLTMTGIEIEPTENEEFSGVVATFVDTAGAESLSDYTNATIDWGDGTEEAPDITSGVISGPDSNGVFTISGTHTYTDEGDYDIVVTVHHETLSPDPSVTTSISVFDPEVDATGDEVVHAMEGNLSDSQVVATFTDPAGAESVDDYTATIDWGDGTDPEAADEITYDYDTDTFYVWGSHTYAEESADDHPDSNPYVFHVTIEHGTAEDVTVEGTAEVDEAPLTDNTLRGTADPIIATGHVVSWQGVAEFTDQDHDDEADDFTAQIDWGDGEMSDGTVTGADGTFTVEGEHTYDEEGAWKIEVTLEHSDGRSETARTTAYVVADLSATEEDFTATAGQQFVGTVATFTDPDTIDDGDDYTATIVWGDGTSSVGQVDQTGTDTFTVTADHTYAHVGNYLAVVTITDGPTGWAQAVDSVDVELPLNMIQVSEPDPLLQLTGIEIAPAKWVMFNGAVATYSADGGGADYDYATIDWGDGFGIPDTSPGTITGPDSNGIYTVSGSHTYWMAGIYAVTVTIGSFGTPPGPPGPGPGLPPPNPSDPPGGGSTASETTLIEVKGMVARGLANEGSEETSLGPIIVATICDADLSDQLAAQIHWGDGSTSPGTVVRDFTNWGMFEVVGEHDYADDGVYAVHVVITNGQGGSETAWTDVVIDDAPLDATANEFGGAPGLLLNDIVVASFTDPMISEESSAYTATISWGDGETTTGEVIGQFGNFDILGTHTYAEPGHYYTQIVINDPSGQAVVVGATVTIEGAIEGVDTPFTLGSFLDQGGPEDIDDYDATIDWGDGEVSTGTIVPSGSYFLVEGSHAYAEETDDPYTITVTVHHEEDIELTLVTTQTVVWDAALHDAGEEVTNTITFEGVPNDDLIVATFTDDDANGEIDDYSATIYWGDGTSSSETSFTESDGVFSVHGEHTYAEEGTYYRYAIIFDVGGAHVKTDNVTVEVADAPLIAGAVTPPNAPRKGETVPEQVLFHFLDEAGDYADIEDFQATIFWGDGQVATVTHIANDDGVIVANGDGFDVRGTHKFVQSLLYGEFRVDVVDEGGSSVTGIYGDYALSDGTLYRPNVVWSPTSGAGTLSNVLLFHFDEDPIDPDVTVEDFTATINWGDSNQSTVTSVANDDGYIAENDDDGGFDVFGSHTYDEPLLHATFQVSVLKTHGATIEGSIDDFAVVTEPQVPTSPANSTLTVTSFVPPPVNVEGESFTNAVLMHFTDSSSTANIANYSAIITWGDGTTSTVTSAGGTDGQIVANDNGFDVCGTHLYSETVDAGTFQIALSDGSACNGSPADPVVATSTPFNIGDAPLTLSPWTPPMAMNVRNEILAHFTDADSQNADPSVYTATIKWGDSSVSTITSTYSADGIIRRSGSGFDVYGSHRYTKALSGNEYKIEISDEDGASVSSGMPVYQIMDVETNPDLDTLTPLDDSLTTGHDVPLEIDPFWLIVNDTDPADPSGDSLEIVSIDNLSPDNTLVWNLDHTLLNFTPKPGFVGEVTFNYTVFDPWTEEWGETAVVIHVVNIDLYWDGSAGNGLWSDKINWDTEGVPDALDPGDHVAPVDGDTLIFDRNFAEDNTQSQDDILDLTIQGMVFKGNGFGISLQLPPNAVPNAFNTLTIEQSITDNGTGNSIGGATGTSLEFDDATVYVDGSLNTLIIRSVISGESDFTKQGSGTLSLEGANTFRGDLHIEGGSIQVRSDSGLGDSSNLITLDTGNGFAGEGLIVNGGSEQPVTISHSLMFLKDSALGAFSSHVTFTGPIYSDANPGSIVIATPSSFEGWLRLEETDASFTKDIVVMRDATLIAAADGSLGRDNAGVTVVEAGGTLVFENVYYNSPEPVYLKGEGALPPVSGNPTPMERKGALIGIGQSSFAGPITLLGDARIKVEADSDLTLTGGIGDDGEAWDLVRFGAGTLHLGGSNTYTGATYLLQGRTIALVDRPFGALVADGHLIPGNGTSISDGAALDLNGFDMGDEAFTVIGTGLPVVGTLSGPIFNQRAFEGTVRSVTLAGNTTFGVGSWRIWNETSADLDLAGYKLTLSGFSTSSMVLTLGATTVTGGDIDIVYGTLNVTYGSIIEGESLKDPISTQPANRIYVRANGKLAFGNWCIPIQVTRQIVIDRGTIADAGDEATIHSPIKLVGASTPQPSLPLVTFDIGQRLTFDGLVDGRGAAIRKQGGGEAIFQGAMHLENAELYACEGTLTLSENASPTGTPAVSIWALNPGGTRVLNVDAGVTLTTNSFSIQYGTLTGAGTLIATGTIWLKAGSMTGSGVTKFVGPGTSDAIICDFGNIAINQRRLENARNTFWSGFENLDISNGATILNTADGTFTIQSTGQSTTDGNNQFINRGTFRSGVNPRSFNVNFLNQGGTIDVTGGSLSLIHSDATFDRRYNLGTVNIANGASLNYNGATYRSQLNLVSQNYYRIGVNDGTEQLLATFTGVGVANNVIATNFRVTIDWGDGFVETSDPETFEPTFNGAQNRGEIRRGHGYDDTYNHYIKITVERLANPNDTVITHILRRNLPPQNYDDQYVVVENKTALTNFFTFSNFGEAVKTAANGRNVIYDTTNQVATTQEVTPDNPLWNDRDPENDPFYVDTDYWTGPDAVAPHGGTLHVDGSDLIYVPDIGFSGVDWFTYRTSDGGDKPGNIAVVTMFVVPNVADNAGAVLGMDPDRGSLQSVGTGAIDLNTGSLRLTEPLDFDQSPGTDVGGNPALVYNSATVAPSPVFNFSFPYLKQELKPTRFGLDLTWDGQTYHEDFYPDGKHEGTNGYYSFSFTLPVTVTSTGAYSWTAGLTEYFGNSIQVPAGVFNDRIWDFPLTNGPLASITFPLSGVAPVVVRDNSPFGSGWYLDGLTQIWANNNGALMIYGSGDTRYFPADPGHPGQYFNPSEDYGVLSKTDNTFEYVSNDQTTWDFGQVVGCDIHVYQLTRVADRHNQVRSYTWNVDTLTVASPDTSVTTITFGANQVLMSSPGSRDVRLDLNNGILTAIEHRKNVVAGNGTPETTRTFGYTTSGPKKINSDNWDPLTTWFYYDTHGYGQLTKVQIPEDPENPDTIVSEYTITSRPARGYDDDNLEYLFHEGPVLIGIGDPLVRAADPARHKTNFELDNRGRVLTQISQSGAKTRFTRNSAGEVVSSTDPVDQTTTYTYTNGDLRRIDYADSTYVTFTYDNTWHQLTGKRDERGYLTTYLLNGHGDVRETINALNQHTTMVWNNGLLGETIDANNNRTTYLYDNQRRLQATWNADDTRTTFTYDVFGNRETTKDALNNVVTTTYDSIGRLKSTLDPVGGRTDYDYFDSGLVKTVAVKGVSREIRQDVFSDVVTTIYEYDTRGSVTKLIEDSGGLTERWTLSEYDLAGNLTTLTRGVTTGAVNPNDPTQHPVTTVYRYDDSGRLITTLEGYSKVTITIPVPPGAPLGTLPISLPIETYESRTDITYDAADRVLTRRDPRGSVTSYGYDRADRVVTFVENAENRGSLKRTTYSEYDAAGNLVKVTDPLGRITTMAYDPLNRLVSKTEAAGTIDQRVTETQYDAVGNVLYTIDGRFVRTSFAYDSMNRRTRMIEAYGESVERTTAFKYDVVGNMTEVISPNGSSTKYDFDAAHRVTTITQNAATYWSPDRTDPLVLWSNNTGNAIRVSGFKYDVSGNVTWKIDPASTTDPATTLTYTQFTYDALNRRTGMYEAAQPNPNWTAAVSYSRGTTYLYDTTDNLVSMTSNLVLNDPMASNVSVTTYRYDNLNRKVSQTLAASAAQLSLGHNPPTTTYTYSREGQLVTLTGPRGYSTRYEYDALGRLTTMTEDGRGITETHYDLVSNMLWMKNARGVVTSYGYDNLNRRTEVIQAYGTLPAGVTLQHGSVTNSTRYDANDNVIVTWDGLNRLTLTEYDKLNRPTTITEAATDTAERVTIREYDEVSNLTTLTYGLAPNDPTANKKEVTAYQYNWFNEVISVTRAADLADPVHDLGHAAPVTRTFYNPDGSVFMTVDPIGGFVAYKYDNLRRVTETKQGQFPVGANPALFTYAQVPFSAIVTMIYDAAGNLIRSVRGTGGNGIASTSVLSTTTYRYDALNRRVEMIEAVGDTSAQRRTTYLYDAENNLIQQTSGIGSATWNTGVTTRFQYDSSNRLIVKIDAYEDPGLFRPEPHPQWRNQMVGHESPRTDYAYDGADNVISVTDPRGVMTVNKYDALNRLIETSYALSDRAAWLVMPAGANGDTTPTTRYIYNEVGNLIYKISPTDVWTKFEYDALNRQTTMTEDFLGDSERTTVTRYDAVDNVLSVTKGLAGGNPAPDFAKVVTTVYEYDVLNRLRLQISAFGATDLTDGSPNTSFTYRADGILIHQETIVDATTVSTIDFAYDTLKRRTSVIENQGVAGAERRTVSTYDASGNLRVRTDTTGVTTTSNYDALGRVTRTENAVVTTYMYDARNNLVFKQTPTDRQVTTYDALNRTKVGYRIRVDAQNLDVLQVVRDLLSGSTPTGSVIEQPVYYFYDAGGNLLELRQEQFVGNVSVNGGTPSLNRTLYVYDALGRNTRRTDSSDRTAFFVYYADGQLQRTTDRMGRIRDFTYDGLGNLIQDLWKASDGTVQSTLTYEYDAAGNLLMSSKVDVGFPDPLVNFRTYDSLGRKVTEMMYVLCPLYMVNYVYSVSPCDRTRTQTQNVGFTFNGVDTTFTYTSLFDADNRLINRTVSQNDTTLAIADQTFKSAGGASLDLAATQTFKTSDTDPNSVNVNYTYSPQARVTTIAYQIRGLDLEKLEYTYDDALGRMTREARDAHTISLNPNPTNPADSDYTKVQTFTYDRTSQQVTNAPIDRDGVIRRSFTILAVDNRLMRDDLFYYQYNAEGSLWYTRDRAGTDDAPQPGNQYTTYTYDHLNHLTMVQTATTTVTYRYDAEGNRVVYRFEDSANAANSKEVRYANVNGQVLTAFTISLADNPSNSFTQYLRGDKIDQLWGRIDSGGGNLNVNWYVTDMRGSVFSLVNPSAQVTGRWAYEGTGKRSEKPGSIPESFAYTGRELDANGLQYNRARYYDARTSRWLSQDPIGFAAGDSNLYRYVGNRPSSLTDPSGLVWYNPVDWGRATVDYVAPIWSVASGREAVRAAQINQQQQELYDSGAPGIAAPTGSSSIFGNYVGQMGELHDAYRDGLRIGATAVANATADTLVSTVTFGTYSTRDVLGDDLIHVRDEDRAYYDVSYGFARGGTEILAGVATGGLSRVSTVGRVGRLVAGAARIHSALGSAVQVGRAGADMIENGVSFNNVVSMASGALNLGTTAAAARGVNCANSNTLNRLNAALGMAANGAGVVTNVADMLVNGVTTENAFGLFNSATGFYNSSRALNACFSGDTKLLARGSWGEGWRRIDQITLGDELLSRDENDANGPLEWKRAVQLFVRTGRIWHLHVGSQLIRTTGEHPFFVHNRGWIEASALQAGDLLCTAEGQWVAMEEVYDTGDYETVYNVCVADFHTYFVGGELWRYGVWAHNISKYVTDVGVTEQKDGKIRIKIELEKGKLTAQQRAEIKQKYKLANEELASGRETASPRAGTTPFNSTRGKKFREDNILKGGGPKDVDESVSRLWHGSQNENNQHFMSESLNRKWGPIESYVKRQVRAQGYKANQIAGFDVAFS